MKSRKDMLLTLSILSLAVFTIGLTPLFAFTTIGSWLDSNIPPLMSANQDGTSDCTGEFQALSLSGRTWNNVSTSYFYFAKRIPTLNTRHAGTDDDYNQLSWDPAPPSDYIAVTYNFGWAHINESDISFNSNYNWNCEGNPSYTEMDVQNIATHELGHSLGLGHTSYSDATMYAYASYGETKKRTLHFDDIDGIEYLYPAALMEEGDEAWASPGEKTGFFLAQPVRNFRGFFEIDFGVAAPGEDPLDASLVLYDSDGEVVRVIVDETMPGGMHTTFWDGRNDAGELVREGVFFLTLDAGGSHASRKILPLSFTSAR
jgi:hypothetical protein